MHAADLHIESDPPRLVARLPSRELALPAIWLRERCRDPEQLDPDTRQRLFDPHRLPVDLALTGIRDDPDGAGIRIDFSDGHSGWYAREQLVDDVLAEIEGTDGLPEVTPWDASLPLSQMRFHWPTVVAGGDGLGAAAGRFLEYGFIVLHDVPTEPERILEVARTFGHPRETNFGTYFEVYSRPRSNDLAYRAVALGPHTDNPYREPVPGIQLLHCLVNETSGGLSTLVDSLAVAQQLCHEDPDGLELLATIPVRFRFVDQGEELIERRTIIQCDVDGCMTGVHYSPRLDYLPVLDEETTRRFQAARRRLGELFTDPRFELQFPLQAGELMMFDNSRVLHGRTAYDPAEGRRHLQGCYIDLDGPRSLYRTHVRRSEREE